MRLREKIALAAAVATVVLVGTDAWPGLRGPENWRWARRPLASAWPLLGLALVFLAQVGVARRVAAVWGTGRSLVRVPWLSAAILLTFASMVLLTAAEPGGLANVPRRVLDPSFTSYHTVAARVDDVRDFLRRYPRLQHRFPVHGPSQPPGRVLFFHAANRWAGASPERTARLLAWGERLGGVPKGPGGTTDAQRAGALVAGYLLMLLGAGAVAPVIAVVGGRFHAPASGAAVLLMGVLPSYLLFTPQTDHLVLLLTLGAAAFLLEAMRFAARRKAVPFAFAAGLAAGLSLFVSFTSLAALGAWGVGLAGMVAFGVRRGVPLPSGRKVARLAGAGAVGFLLPVLAVAGAGMDWLAVFRECLVAAARVQTEIHGRRYSTWVVWNLWDFVLFLGLPLTVVWLGRTRDEIREWRRGRGLDPAARITGEPLREGLLEIPFALTLVAVVLGLDLSGRILGETGRIWMFLMPLAVGAAAVSYGRRPLAAALPLAAAQWIVLVALRAWVNVPG